MQQRLKASARAARTGVVPAEPLKELLVAVDEAVTALHARFAEGTPYGACSSTQKRTSSSYFMA